MDPASTVFYRTPLGLEKLFCSLYILEFTFLLFYLFLIYWSNFKLPFPRQGVKERDQRESSPPSPLLPSFFWVRQCWRLVELCLELCQPRLQREYVKSAHSQLFQPGTFPSVPGFLKLFCSLSMYHVIHHEKGLCMQESC